MQDILDLGIEELKDALRDMGEKPFRAGQIYSWLNEKLVFDFEDMTNLSKPLREKLKKNFRIGPVTMVARQISQIDKTEKFLFRLHDGHMVETVLMRYKHGNSVCISSQVGCRMGCRFCASTIDGWIRNLTPGEMLGQIYKVQQISGERVSNIVVMGTGEPLDNYDNLLAFIHRISDEKGLNISQRNITVSTCGLVPAIYALADENLAITLALSLHGATQEKREALMPIAKKYTLDEVMGACRHYFKKTGRRMSYEYALLDGVSNTDACARELIHLLKGQNCHVNLIPVNPIKERDYKRPARGAALEFQNKLEKSGINVTIRREMGSDIDGACGQLRRRYDSGSGEKED